MCEYGLCVSMYVSMSVQVWSMSMHMYVSMHVRVCTCEYVLCT